MYLPRLALAVSLHCLILTCDRDANAQSHSLVWKYCNISFERILKTNMEALAATASIIAVLQLTTACLKAGKKYIGPSSHSPESLREILATLYRFNGTLNNLKLHLEINEEDQARLQALNHLDEPLRHCESVLRLLQNRLANVTVLGQYVVGERFDGKLKKDLNGLEDARALFELALQSDQQ